MEENRLEFTFKTFSAGQNLGYAKTHGIPHRYHNTALTSFDMHNLA